MVFSSAPVGWLLRRGPDESTSEVVLSAGLGAAVGVAAGVWFLRRVLGRSA